MNKAKIEQFIGFLKGEIEVYLGPKVGEKPGSVTRAIPKTSLVRWVRDCETIQRELGIPVTEYKED